MGRLAGSKVRDVEKRLRKLGFTFEREAGGSHEIWRNAADDRFVLVRHPGDYPEGLLRASLADANVTVDQFLRAR